MGVQGRSSARLSHGESTIYAVDFDGTLCQNNYPAVGIPNVALIDFLKKEQKRGCKVILWTCRCGLALKTAVECCKMQGLEFDAVNENLPESIERFGDDPRKICADVYIDDRYSTCGFEVPFYGEHK